MVRQSFPPGRITKDYLYALFDGVVLDGPGLLLPEAKLAERVAAAGGSLAELLPALREAGLREPSPGRFGPPLREQPAIQSQRLAATPPPAVKAETETDTEATPMTLAPLVSYFVGPISNVRPQRAMRPAEVAAIIRGEALREQTAAIRDAVRQEGRSSAAAEQAKKRLPYITPAGTVSPTRSDANLQAYSGLMVLDFDKLPDLDTAKAALLTDAIIGPAIALLFTSPRGDGLKVLVSTGTCSGDPAKHYKATLLQAAGYLAHHYGGLGLSFDPSGKDISRACFLCHDPLAYLHPSLSPSL